MRRCSAQCAELPEAERPPKLEAPDGGLGSRDWLSPAKAVLSVAAGVGALPVVCSTAAPPGVPPSGAPPSSSPASVLLPRPCTALLPLLRPNRRLTLPQAAAKMPRCLPLLALLPDAAGGCAFAGVCGSQDAMGSQLAGTWDGGSKGSSSAAVLPPSPGDVSRACLPRRKPHMPPLPCGRSVAVICGGTAVPPAAAVGGLVDQRTRLRCAAAPMRHQAGSGPARGAWAAHSNAHLAMVHRLLHALGLRSGRPGGRRGSCRPAGNAAFGPTLGGAGGTLR